MASEQFVPIDLAAKILRVSRRTIFNYIKNGRLNSVKQGKNTLIAIREIETIRSVKKGEFPKKFNNNGTLNVKSGYYGHLGPEWPGEQVATIQLDLSSHVILKRNEYETLILRLAKYENEIQRLKGECNKNY